MDTARIAAFADGEYEFWLPMPRVIAFEREADCSIFELFQNLGQHLGVLGDNMVLAGASPARLKQCHSLIRNALIGGGTSELDARDLVEMYCYPARAAIYDLELAWRVLETAIYGIKTSGSKKKGTASSKPSAKASS